MQKLVALTALPQLALVAALRSTANNVEPQHPLRSDAIGAARIGIVRSMVFSLGSPDDQILSWSCKKGSRTAATASGSSMNGQWPAPLISCTFALGKASRLRLA